MKKSLALVIGNAKYKKTELQLNNAVNDAEDIAAKLETLGYKVNLVTDCTNQQFEEAVAAFGSELMDYEVGLFFFSGHGLQIDNKNYLTAIDTNYFDETSIPGTAFLLDRVITYMNRSNAEIKLLILDACRNNPFIGMYRGYSDLGLAPIYAPKGSLIAFSTSPGEKAMDSGMGRNSVYTGALLKHIDDKYVRAEEVFKRVRTSVSALTKGKQTSWEHTSLIGDYYFNYGQRILSKDLPYNPEAIIDESFIAENSGLAEIIRDLKSYTFDTQNEGIRKIYRLKPGSLNKSEQFVLGRNVLQAAEGGSFTAADFIRNIEENAKRFKDGENNHFLNGILFEVYFNKKGEFRIDGLKMSWLQQLLYQEPNTDFKSAFAFIRRVLEPFQDQLFYLPGNTTSVAIDIRLAKKNNERDGDFFAIEEIKHLGNDIYNKNHYRAGTIKSFNELKQQVAEELGIPERKLTLTTNFPEKELGRIKIKYNLGLSKNINSDEEEW